MQLQPNLAAALPIDTAYGEAYQNLGSVTTTLSRLGRCGAMER